MTIEHVNATDPNIHEPKGVSSASAGQVYVADGVGSGDWGAISADLTLTEVLSAQATASQGPSGTDSAYQVLFGAAQFTGSDPVSLSAAGAITFNEAGEYLVEVEFNYGRTGGTGVAQLHQRALLNAAAFGNTSTVYLEDAEASVTLCKAFSRTFSATDILTYEIIRDSVGNDSGGLVDVDPTLAGWANTPSASITIHRLV